MSIAEFMILVAAFVLFDCYLYAIVKKPPIGKRPWYYIIPGTGFALYIIHDGEEDQE